MKTKRIFGLLVFLCMAFALLPGTALATSTSAVSMGREEDLTRGKYFIFSANGVAQDGRQSEYNVWFDSINRVLYLNNLNITVNGNGIIATAPITIVLQNGSSNSIVSQGVGIKANALTVRGDGSLTVNTPYDAVDVDELTVEGNVTLIATSTGDGRTGVTANGNVTIKDRSELTATGTGDGSTGVTANGNVTVTTDSKLTATGKEQGLLAYGDLTVDGGEVEGTVHDDFGRSGIFAIGIEVKNGGKLTGISAGTYFGVISNNDITVSGGSELTGAATGRDGDGVHATNITVSGNLTGTSTNGVGISVGSIRFNGGTVVATGGDNALCSLTPNPGGPSSYTAAVLNSTVAYVATANTTTSATGASAYNPANFATYKFLRIENAYSIIGTVTGNDTGAGLVGANVQLKRGGANVGSAAVTTTGGAYTIANVPAGTGYTVEVNMTGYETGTISAFNVTNSNVTDKNIALALSPPSAPRISVQPLSQSVTEGQTATFSAIAAGNPAPTYQWQVLTDNDASWENVTDVATSSYTTPITTMAMSGYQYRCVASNGTSPNATSGVATLTVTAAPIYTIMYMRGINGLGDEKNVSKNAGETISLEGALFLRGGYRQTGWMRDNSTVKDFELRAAYAADESIVLYPFWEPFSSEESGEDDDSSSIVITLHPEDQYVAKGQRATFSVAATGEGLGYQWQINRNDRKGWQTLDGATSKSYTTPMVRLHDNGYLYKCWVSDGNRNYAESNAAVLYVANAGALPQTGDSATPGLWLAMMMLGGLGLLLTCWRRRA